MEGLLRYLKHRKRILSLLHDSPPLSDSDITQSLLKTALGDMVAGNRIHHREGRRGRGQLVPTEEGDLRASTIVVTWRLCQWRSLPPLTRRRRKCIGQGGVAALVEYLNGQL